MSDRIAGIDYGQALSSLLEVCPLGYALLNSDLTILLASSGFLKMLDYAENDLLGTPFTDLLVEPEPSRFSQEVMRSDVWEGNVTIQGAHASEVRVHLWMAMSKSDELFHCLLEPLAGSGAGADEAGWRVLIGFLDSLEDGVMITDETDTIIYANPVLEEIFGSWKGRKRSEYLRIPDDHLARTCAGRGRKRIRREWHCDVNDRTYDIIESPLPRADGTVWTVEILRDMTDRKSMEQALARSEAIYRYRFENSPMALWEEDHSGINSFINQLQQQGITDLNTHFDQRSEDLSRCLELRRVIHANRACLDLFQVESVDGFSRLITTNFKERLLPLFKQIVVGMARGRHEIAISGSFVTALDEERHLNLRWVVAPGYESTMGRLLVSASDVTALKRIEDALKRSEQKYRLISENVPVVVYSALPDRHTSTVFLSGRIKALTGYTSREMIEDPDLWRRMLHPDDRSRVLAAIESQNQKGESLDIEYRIVTKDGTIKWVRDCATPIHNLKGEVIRVTGFLEDITEKKLAEQAVLESEARFRSLADDLPNMVFIEAGGRIVYANHQFEEVLACERSEDGSVDVGFTSFVDDDSVASVENYLARVIKGEGTGALECKLRTSQGRLLEVLLSCRRIDYRGDRAVLAIATDITDRKRLEQELRNYSKDLERIVEARTARIEELERQRIESEKLAATGRMAARIAHEINNPLGGIKNAFLLLKDAIPNDHPYYGYVGMIEKEIDRIARIVRRMFDLYRQDRIEPVEVDPVEVARDVVTLLEPTARSCGVSIHTSFGDKSLKTLLPRGYLDEVLFNLIQNAIEASTFGGKVIVALTRRGDDIVVEVVDEGVGIPPEIQAKIFEPFFTTKADNKTSGLGLGLSVTRGMVEAMGGKIDFTSRQGEGTTFTVTIPIRLQSQEVQDG